MRLPSFLLRNRPGRLVRGRLARWAVVAAAAVLPAGWTVGAIGTSSAGSPRGAGALLEGRLPFGIGDQNPAIFADPRFAWLGIGYARVIVPWDAAEHPGALERAYIWLNAARAAGVRPLVAFQHGVTHPRGLPSLSAYAHAVRAFLRRFPWVTDYQAWNEANGNEPTFFDPRAAAEFFNSLQGACRHCTVTAADVLDAPTLVSWVRRFLRYAHHPRLWGLHTYYELSYSGHDGLSQLLHLVPGQIWFTEAGNAVWRYVAHAHAFEVGSEATQVKAVRRLLILARLSGRISRVYYYQWRTPTTLAQAEAEHHHHRRVTVTWDSGVMRPDCSPRPAFGVIARALGHNPRDTPHTRRGDHGLACPPLTSTRRSSS
jgi:hypothetical protein